MAIKAKKEGLAFSHITGRVTKHMTTSAPRKIARLEIALQMIGAPEAAHARLEEIARTCPVALSLGDVDVPLSVLYA